MNDLIDFTDLPVRKKTYAGANGSKLSVMYQGIQYMDEAVVDALLPNWYLVAENQRHEKRPVV